MFDLLSAHPMIAAVTATHIIPQNSAHIVVFLLYSLFTVYLIAFKIKKIKNNKKKWWACNSPGRGTHHK
jgi:hypothetical protein